MKTITPPRPTSIMTMTPPSKPTKSPPPPSPLVMEEQNLTSSQDDMELSETSLTLKLSAVKRTVSNNSTLKSSSPSSSSSILITSNQPQQQKSDWKSLVMKNRLQKAKDTLSQEKGGQQKNDNLSDTNTDNNNDSGNEAQDREQGSFMTAHPNKSNRSPPHRKEEGGVAMNKDISAPKVFRGGGLMNKFDQKKKEVEEPNEVQPFVDQRNSKNPTVSVKERANGKITLFPTSDSDETSDSDAMKTWPPERKPSIYTIQPDQSESKPALFVTQSYKRTEGPLSSSSDREEVGAVGADNNRARNSRGYHHLNHEKPFPTYGATTVGIVEHESDSTGDEMSSLSLSGYEEDTATYHRTRFNHQKQHQNQHQTTASGVGGGDGGGATNQIVTRNYKRNITGSLDTVSSLGMSTIVEGGGLNTRGSNDERVSRDNAVSDDDHTNEFITNDDGSSSSRSDVLYSRSTDSTRITKPEEEEQEVIIEEEGKKKEKEEEESKEKIISEEAHHYLQNLMFRSSLSRLEQAKDKLGDSVKHLTHSKQSGYYPTTPVPPMQQTSHYHHYLIHQPKHHNQNNRSSLPSSSSMDTSSSSFSISAQKEMLLNSDFSDDCLTLDARRNTLNALLPLSSGSTNKSSVPSLRDHSPSFRQRGGPMTQRMREIATNSAMTY